MASTRAPVSFIPRVIRHLTHCKAAGTLIVPQWVSSPFWPMLFGIESPYHSLVEGIITFTDVAGIFVMGSSKSIFDGSKFKSYVLAVRLSACYLLIISLICYFISRSCNFCTSYLHPVIRPIKLYYDCCNLCPFFLHIYSFSLENFSH